MFPSSSCIINLAPSVSESSPRGNNSELSDKIGGCKSGVLSVRADWLNAFCHTNLVDTYCDDVIELLEVVTCVRLDLNCEWGWGGGGAVGGVSLTLLSY